MHLGRTLAQNLKLPRLSPERLNAGDPIAETLKSTAAGAEGSTGGPGRGTYAFAVTRALGFRARAQGFGRR